MHNTTASLGKRWILAATIVAATVTAVRTQPQSISFQSLAPGYAEQLFATTANFSKGSILGGVVVLQNGDVITAECTTDGTVLHRFSAAQTAPDPDDGQLVHAESTYAAPAAGCGIALGLDGTIYSNAGDPSFGVARIDPNNGNTLATFAAAPTGNALGIATNPLTGHLVYAGASCRPVATNPATCTLYDLDPVTGAALPFIALNTHQFLYVDGLEYDPSGLHLFATNRAAVGATPTSTIKKFDLIVMSGALGTATVLQDVPATAEPIGIAFNGASPKFVVTDNQDDTLTRFDFAGDDYTQAPTQTVFASDGFRGDLMQVGPDTCLYVTQAGVRYDDGYTNQRTNSIVQICDGFAPPPGVTPNPPARSSLSGSVYVDANDNGVADKNELPIGGVTISLDGTDDWGRAVSLTTTTGSDGSYAFPQLRSGVYSVAETQPAGYLDGKDTQGSPGGGTVINDAINNITLKAGVDGSNNNFGEVLASSLAGYVYVDANNDGTKQAGEAGIPGVTVTLTGTDDLGASVSMAATTGSDGAYMVGDLRPGTYTLTETQPDGYLDGKDTQGTPGGGAVHPDAFTNIKVASGTMGQDNDFADLPGAPAVTIVTKTNGTDNDAGTGPIVPAGSTVTWTYVVTNTGNDSLSNITVVDDKAGAVNCPTSLKAGASFTCTKTGTAVVGQYHNVGTVTGTDPFKAMVTASNADGYFGASADLAVTSSTAATVTAGGTLSYVLQATNVGPSDALGVDVSISVPKGMTLSSLAGPTGWHCDVKSGSCTADSLVAGQGASFTATAQLKCPFPVAGPADAIATIGSDTTPDPDMANNTSTAITNVINPAPAINVASVDGTDLWPPNHKMKDVTIDYTVVPGCGGITSTKLNVSCNEGDASDWEVVDLHHVKVRSERAGGNKAGRVYNITITATDVTGPSASQTVVVAVPHDQGHGK